MMDDWKEGCWGGEGCNAVSIKHLSTLHPFQVFPDWIWIKTIANDSFAENWVKMQSNNRKNNNNNENNNNNNNNNENNCIKEKETNSCNNLTIK